MTRSGQFEVYDLNRQKPHKLASPPARISKSRLEGRQWIASKPAAMQAKRSNKVQKKTGALRTPKRASDLLRCEGAEFQCLECNAASDEASCGIACLRKFRRENFGDFFEIRGPGPLGYGAWTKPKTNIAKGDWVGEYLGELLPFSAPSSTYRFEIPDVCVVDAEQAGNWTRFINSHCEPNVKPWGETIGKRHVILFQAIRDIGPGEEIVFYYGPRYFDKAGFLCRCDAQVEPHMPMDSKVKIGARTRTNSKL